MKKKFLLTLALVAGLGITGFATTADAGNIKDEPYKFYISSSGSIAHTDIRPKYDDTSAYIRHDYLERTAYSNNAYKVAVVDSNGNYFSKTWWTPYFYCFSYPPTEAWIPNHAYEDKGYGVQVRLRAEGEGGSGIWSATGVWSPDSVGGK
ncbi:hypothetical protein [Clostridium sp. UBA1056]|uniref:hypothetical protein n=1 Tax=unclassified Clostridium TaxID=2614128 RepID=UPI00321714A4